MISLPIFWVFVATFIFVWILKRGKENKGRKIPGPRAYPILGNALQIAGKHQHEVFNKWTKEYGDFYRVKFGKETAIVVSDLKMIKELLMNDPNYVGRPHFDGFDLYEDEKLGIVNSEGELWEVHRRFLLRQLRDFGFGKSAMESLIQEEVTEVISRFKASEGKPIGNIKPTLSLAVINSLWTVVSCQRFKHDDPKLNGLVANTTKIIEDLFKDGALLMFIPWLSRYVMPERSGYNKIREVLEENRAWFEEIVAEHKKTFQEDNLRDFIDVFLAEMKKTTDPQSVFYGDAAERQLVATLSDLFFAGSDTTSSTLSWGILYLSKFPEVQKKFQAEIASISNNSRSISVTDRPRMPYTLALIDEVLRFSSIVPDGVQHRALEGKEFRDYFIPKNAWIMPNMHFLHHDPKTWGDPENFRPERFIGTDGSYKKNDNLIAFQLGRRQCVGETLARDTVFLFLTNIFQRFDVSFDPSLPEPSLEPGLNFLLSPLPYSVIMTDRL